MNNHSSNNEYMQYYISNQSFNVIYAIGYLDILRLFDDFIDRVCVVLNQSTAFVMLANNRF